MAAGVLRISEPLPAACPDRAKCSAAATSHGRPEPRTARVWLPTSRGPASSQVRKRWKTSASSRPPRSISEVATSSAICVSSVNSPGAQPQEPPPHISVCAPRAGVGKRAENRPGGPNSNGAPRASPTAEPTSAPATRWERCIRVDMVFPPGELAQRRANPKLDGIRANVNDVYRDSSGKALTDYPRPSVAVDTAVLTVPDDDPRLSVLLVRRAVGHRGSEWSLPGTFLHEGETLAVAVGRSLREKAGLAPEVAPRQLHVFDDPARDDRGWVLSVAHVAALPWRQIEPVLGAGGGVGGGRAGGGGA